MEEEEIALTSTRKQYESIKFVGVLDSIAVRHNSTDVSTTPNITRRIPTTDDISISIVSSPLSYETIESILCRHGGRSLVGRHVKLTIEILD